MARKLERSVRLEHKYEVGQVVELTPNSLRAAAIGQYEIRQAMPTSDNSLDSPRYRIKSVAENHERIVAESELILPTGVSREAHAEQQDLQLPRIEI